VVWAENRLLLTRLEGTVELWSMRCILAINRCLAGELTWPDARERLRIAASIGKDSPFPDCVGVVDGTSIHLQYKPGVDGAVDYWHYKGWYGLQMMAVCDDRRQFRYILLGFPGSPHDSRVFGRTAVSLNPSARYSRVSVDGPVRSVKQSSRGLLLTRPVGHGGFGVQANGLLRFPVQEISRGRAVA
jgi:hypothetical protein